MANNKTLTSANSTFILTVPGLLSGVHVQGYSTDEMFAFDAVPQGETVMGVDGKLSSGYTPQPRRMTLTLQADSKSNDTFDFWARSEAVARERYPADAVITAPSIGKSYVLRRGFLESSEPMPGHKKTLQPRPYVIVWEDVVPADI